MLLLFPRSIIQELLDMATGAPKETAGPLLSPFPVAMLVTRFPPLEELEDEEELEEEDPGLESESE